jgi:Nuclease-related domain
VLKLGQSKRSRAGGYAQQRFEEGAKAWRRRVLPRALIILIPIAGLCIAYEVISPMPLHFVAGAYLGAALACYMWLRDSPPFYIEKWRLGADGERATGKALASLRREGWHTLHDLPTPRGNRDHVVVGPGGAFLLDSKNLGGEVSVQGDVLRVERLDDPRESYELPHLAGWMRGEAAKLKDEIGEVAKVRWVSAVVVIWASFPQRIVEGDRVVFLHGDELAGWLRGRTYSQAPEITEQIVETLAG